MSAIDWRGLWSFLDYSGDRFSSIQSNTLKEQFASFANNPVIPELVAGPDNFTSVDEFRARTRLSTWDDYSSFLKPASDPMSTWAYTQYGAGFPKWSPYSKPALDHLADSVISSIGLAASQDGKTANIKAGDRALYNIPPRPYLAGFVGFEIARKFGLKPLISLEHGESMDFKDRIYQGFANALNDRVDILISMTSVLMRVADKFDPSTSQQKSNGSSSLMKRVNAKGVIKLAGAKIKSKITNNQLLPKDLWDPKAVVGWGLDTRFYSEQLENAWGRPPFEMYASTEVGVMGTQFRKQGGLALNPHTCFYEFIPESELEAERADPNYQPRTCLLDEVEPDKSYEVVVTSFFDMPFVRYRLGHIVKFTRDHVGYGNEFLFVGRSDERIDIGGFTRVDESTVWKAISSAGLPIRDWTVRREVEGIVPELHMYAELNSNYDQGHITPTLHKALKDCDPLYSDLESMLGICPLNVSVLSQGTFDAFTDMQLKQGASLVSSRPPRMNASDETIDRLVALDRALALTA